MSNSVRPHRRQPTCLHCPWDSPGKNTGVCCHFLLHCMKVKSESEVAQLCPTLCNPMDCSTPGFPVLHHLSELTQTHVHRVGDDIQPSHPLSPLSPPAFNPATGSFPMSDGTRCHEFSKFSGILSAALSQHHLLGFEIAQLEFHHLH